MAGTKRERSPGTWTLTVTIGTDYTGKKRRFNKTFKGTEREAEKALALFYSDCVRGSSSPGTELTVSQMVQHYINDRPEGSLKVNTIRGYQSVEEHIITPYIGNLKVSKVTPRHIQMWIDDISETHSPKTVKNAKSLLRSAFERLVTYGELDRNPCDRLIMPKLKRKEAEYYTKEETALFISALNKMPREEIVDKVIFELALYCGLRKGEILGLNFADVDLKEMTISVTKTRYAQLQGHMRADTPKTEKSNRVLSFPKEMYADFVTLAAFYSEQKLRLGPEWIDSPALIRGVFGDPMYGGLPLRHLHDFQKKHGLKEITLHQLRHTNVSAMISLGLDIKTIQERGGYSNASTPLEIYGHLFKEQDEKIAADIFDIMTGERKTV